MNLCSVDKFYAARRASNSSDNEITKKNATTNFVLFTESISQYNDHFVLSPTVTTTHGFCVDTNHRLSFTHSYIFLINISEHFFLLRFDFPLTLRLTFFLIQLRINSSTVSLCVCFHSFFSILWRLSLNAASSKTFKTEIHLTCEHKNHTITFHIWLTVKFWNKHSLHNLSLELNEFYITWNHQKSQ